MRVAQDFIAFPHSSLFGTLVAILYPVIVVIKEK